MSGFKMVNCRHCRKRVQLAKAVKDGATICCNQRCMSALLAEEKFRKAKDLPFYLRE